MEWTEKDVRVTKRSDRGGVFYVIVPGTTGWRSSGNTNKRRAIDWALLQATGGISPDTTFGEYARDFFIPGICRRVRMLEDAHGADTLKHWNTLRQMLEDYCLPRWGRTMLAAITAPAVVAWLASDALVSVRLYGEAGMKRPRRLSDAARNKLRVVMKHILDHAAFEGLVRPGIMGMVPIRSSPSSTTDTYTDEEDARLYPDDDAELISLWGSPAWAAYGLVLRDTGARPSEALGLDWAHWYPIDQAFICWQRVGSDGTLGPLKTAKTAAGHAGERRPLLVGARTVRFVESIRPDLPAPGQLLFNAVNGRPLRVDSAGHHLIDVLSRAGVSRVRPDTEGRPRLQYSLRHGRITELVNEIGLAAAQRQAGHAPGSRVTQAVYFHPEDAELIRTARKEAGL